MHKNFLITFFIVLLSLSLAACSDSGSEREEGDATIDAQNSSGIVYERDYSPSIGPDSATVTVVEFFDPACEACRAFYPVVKEIMARHPQDVRVVLRYATFHDGSETVVRMLEAARLQGLFVPVLEALLEAQPEWASHHSPNIDRAWEVAKSAGLNVEAAKKVMNNKEFDQRLAQEKDDIRQLKISRTPTFFVNEKPLTKFGAQELYDLIVSEI